MATYLSGNAKRFEVDPTPRRADGQYVAHARICAIGRDGSASDIHWSGDLAGFRGREDAVAYAETWAHQWLDALLSK
jgi:hypothetical protein